MCKMKLGEWEVERGWSGVRMDTGGGQEESTSLGLSVGKGLHCTRMQYSAPAQPGATRPCCLWLKNTENQLDGKERCELPSKL